MHLPLLILYLSLDVIDGVGGLHLEGDSLSSEGLYEDLHGCDGLGAEWLELRRASSVEFIFGPQAEFVSIPACRAPHRTALAVLVLSSTFFPLTLRVTNRVQQA